MIEFRKEEKHETKQILIQIPNSKSWKNPGQCVFFDSVIFFYYFVFRCSETMVEIYYYFCCYCAC